MLLQRLKEYADERLELPPTLYSERPVRYIIELDGAGRLLNPKPTDTADPESRRTRRGQPRQVPYVQRSIAIRPRLLADEADFTLGMPREPSKAKYADRRHQAFLKLLDRCAVETEEPAVAAVQRFLRNAPLEQLELDDSFDAAATITFRVDGAFPIDLPAVQEFWAKENDPSRASAPLMQCVVCGTERFVTERLQLKIKGVPGGQSSGTSIISANENAFESYGLKASLIAPTCATCGERFTQAANSLLADERHRFYLGGAAFVFWTREDVGFDIRTFFDNPQPEEVRALLQSVSSGRPSTSADETRFYATALSGSGGRAVVRDWIDTTVGEVKRHLGRWFGLQRIVGSRGEEGLPLSIYSLALSTVRETRDLAPPTPRALLRSALTAAPLPPGLLYQAVRRNRAEQRVTRPRAALIKLALLSRQTTLKEDAMVQLDPENPSPAYRCGRLLAVLGQIQYEAIGVESAVDRFYGAASSAPASVFGRLMHGARHHLSKLQRDKPAAYVALQDRLETVLGGLSSTGFPRTLTLEEQGLFALGYYHQRAFDRAQAREAAERRRTGLAPTPD